ncbi:MAG: hypothetical protein IJV45_01365 [Prevotella sp.]|nr:hypothetical protein [Prevotella sp.]
MHKSLLLFLLTAILPVLTASAQQYEVYRIRGEASLVVKQQATPLSKNQVLTPSDIISLAYRSEVKMIVRETQEMITLKGQCAGSIASLIDQQQNARQKMTPDYFNFVVSNLRGEGYNEGLQAGKSTTIYRDDTDSIFVTNGEAYLAEAPEPADVRLPVLVLRPTFLARPVTAPSRPRTPALPKAK